MDYRAIVHYHLKKGMEGKALKFLENELLKKAKELGCHDIELLQDDKDPLHFIGTGLWNSLNEAKKFQSIWDQKEKEFNEFCTSKPQREFFKIRNHFKEKLRKIA